MNSGGFEKWWSDEPSKIIIMIMIIIIITIIIITTIIMFTTLFLATPCWPCWCWQCSTSSASYQLWLSPGIYSNRSHFLFVPWPGLHKVVILLSEITETPISHGIFSLEITYKITKTGYFGHKKFLSQKPVYVTKKLSLTETNFLYRQKFMSQKQIFLPIKISDKEKFPLENKFPSGKHILVQVFVKKKHTSIKGKQFLSQNLFCNPQKFVSQTKIVCHRASW